MSCLIHSCCPCFICDERRLRSLVWVLSPFFTCTCLILVSKANISSLTMIILLNHFACRNNNVSIFHSFSIILTYLLLAHMFDSVALSFFPCYFPRDSNFLVFGYNHLFFTYRYLYFYSLLSLFHYPFFLFSLTSLYLFFSSSTVIFFSCFFLLAIRPGA